MNTILDDFEKIDTYEIIQIINKGIGKITLKNLPLIKNETSFIWVPSKQEIIRVIDSMFATFEKSISKKV